MTPTRATAATLAAAINWIFLWFFMVLFFGVGGFSISLLGFLALHLPPHGHVYARNMAVRLTDEIGLHERRIRQRVNTEAEAVAVEANSADHFFVRAQV